MFGFRKGKDRTKALEALANAPVGAASTVDGKRGVIKGTLLLSEAGDRWIEHLISDIDGALYWLAIENFDRTRATRWDSLEVWDVSGGPDDRQVIHDGATYRRNESGTVAFTSKGDTDMFETGTIDYVDFVGPNGVRIGFERYGEEGAGAALPGNRRHLPQLPRTPRRRCHRSVLELWRRRSRPTRVGGDRGGRPRPYVTDSAGLQ